jgi:translocation and assembly module TamB
MALAAAVLGGTVLGGAGTALRTPAGRAVVVRAALDALNRGLDGAVSVGSVGGSFTGGLDARDVLLSDLAGEPVARLPRLQVRYRVRDLLGGRVVLGQLKLAGPVVTLVQDSTGTLNLERVLRLNRPGGGGPSPLIAFGDVEISDGTVTIVSAPAAGSVGSDGTDGRDVDRRIMEHLDARLSYARLSSPFPGERPFRFDIDDFRVKVSSPAIDLKGARGTVQILGDSLALDLDELRLARSVARVQGALTWPRDTLLYALDVRASRVATEDLQWIMPELKAGLSGRGNATVRSVSGDVLRLRLTNLALTGAGGGGALRGTLGLLLGPGHHRTLEGTDLLADSLDLEYVRPMLDTLPLAGRLSGRFRGEGPEERLSVDVDWTFRDSLVPGRPRSRVVGNGVVALGGPDGLAFHDFAVRQAVLDLGTVRRLVPLDLAGELDAVGTLNGPWRQTEFSGTLRHRDGALPPSIARGVLRVDNRGEVLGLWTDLSLDSLALDGLRPSYPALTVGGALAGDIRLAGYLDSLDLQAHLVGPAGDLTAQGALFLGSERGAHWLDARFARVDLHRLDHDLPVTSLNGRLHGDATLDSAAAPKARGALALDASVVAGMAVDSLRTRFALADSVLSIDTLSLFAPQLWAWAGGGLALGAGREETLRIAARLDSVGVLEPLAQWLWPDQFRPRPDPGPVPERAPSGTAEVGVTIAGTAARFTLRAQVRTPAARWGRLRLRRAEATARWQSIERGVVELDGAVDSLAWEGFRGSGVEARVRGRRDSVGWFARSRWGEDAAWLAGGRLRGDSLRSEVVVDSLAVLLPSEVWFLDRHTRLVVWDSVIALDSTALASASGGAKLGLKGSVPRAGVGALAVSLERIPFADVWALAQRDPAEVSGSMSGTLTLAGTAPEPVMHGKAAFQDVAFRGFRAPYLDGEFAYRARRLGGEFSLWRGGQRVLGISLDLPIDLGLSGAPPERKLPGSLSIRVRADSVDLGFVEAMVPVARQTSGRLNADFGIAGTWQRPQLTGSVAMTDGAGTFPALGVRHEGLSGRLTLVGDTIRVDSLSVQSGTGVATLRGFVRLAQLTQPLLDLRIGTRDFRVMDVRDYLSFSMSGDVALHGPVYGATLTGRGTVSSGVLYFTDLITKQVMNLEDTRYADIIDTSLVRQAGLREEFENRFLDSLRISGLALNMGSEVWLRSTEGNFQLTGELTVSKVADRYRLDGTLETPRGSYRLPLTTSVRSEFTVTRGQLQYFGTPDLNAVVDIDARHVVRRPDQNVTVNVHIGGTLYAPNLTLTSDIRPPISETEIISYLLFGAPSFQALAAGGRNREVLNYASGIVRSAAAAVSGQLERSLINDLGVPVDFLQIRPGDVVGQGLSGTEIAVGKQVTMFGLPTFWTASPRICPQQTTGIVDFIKEFGVSAELRLSSQWRLAASRDPVGPCTGLTSPAGSTLRHQLGLDLFWQRTY